MSELSIDDILALPINERKALVFANAYQDIRRKRGQWGYKVFPEGPKGSSIFKTFITIVDWLTLKGWKISINEKHWVGFIEFCFSESKSVPQPGQLKNPILLRKYILSGFSIVIGNSKSKEEMNILYRKVLRNDLSKHAGIMDALGLRGSSANEI